MVQRLKSNQPPIWRIEEWCNVLTNHQSSRLLLIPKTTRPTPHPYNGIGTSPESKRSQSYMREAKHKASFQAAIHDADPGGDLRVPCYGRNDQLTERGPGLRRGTNGGVALGPPRIQKLAVLYAPSISELHVKSPHTFPMEGWVVWHDLSWPFTYLTRLREPVRCQ